MTLIQYVSGIGPHLAAALSKKGIETPEQLAAASPTVLTEIPGIGTRRAHSLLKAANLALKGDPPKSSEARKVSAVHKARQPAPTQAKPAATADEVEAKAEKKAKTKKAAAKKAKAKKKLEEKSAVEKAAKKRAAKKKAAKEKAAKKAAKKKAKATKQKKNGKSKMK